MGNWTGDLPRGKAGLIRWHGARITNEVKRQPPGLWRGLGAFRPGSCRLNPASRTLSSLGGPLAAFSRAPTNSMLLSDVAGITNLGRTCLAFLTPFALTQPPPLQFPPAFHPASVPPSLPLSPFAGYLVLLSIDFCHSFSTKSQFLSPKIRTAVPRRFSIGARSQLRAATYSLPINLPTITTDPEPTEETETEALDRCTS